jgi:hypothetical protein
MGDTAYGTGKLLDYLTEEKQIEPHLPVWDKSERKDDTYIISDFRWNEETDEYVCPGGKQLLWKKYKSKGTGITKDNTMIYRSSVSDCKDCSLKMMCCPNTSHRKIARN